MIKNVLLTCFVFVLLSCNKGYELRFANYYTGRVDSVLLSEKDLLFSGIEAQTETSYKPVERGEYFVKVVTGTGLRYNAKIFIPGSGSGKRTLQMDGTGSLVILEH